MHSSYKKIGTFIELVDERNKNLSVKRLLGLSITKEFIPSVANTVGTNMANYKVMRKGQFACSTMQVRRDKKMPVALLEDYDEVIVSQAYPVFQIVDTNLLIPEYLMMWFTRSEFDRHACFLAIGGVRGSLEWEDFLEMELPVPSIEKQREIVKEYNTIHNRIKLNEQLNQKLEETAQALYKHWFVDFEFPNKEGQPYKSNGGAMAYHSSLEKDIPSGWGVDTLVNRTTKIGSGSTPRGGKDSYKTSGISLIRSMNVHDFQFKFKELAFIDDGQALKLKNVEVKENDILLNITGASVARCAIVPKEVLPARVNQHVAIIRLKNKSFSNFILCSLCSSFYKRILLGVSVSGSTREAITKEDIEKFEMLFPTDHILEVFDSRIDSLFKQRVMRSSENNILRCLGNLILSKMTKVEVASDLVSV